jgi:hypothetical protein
VNWKLVPEEPTGEMIEAGGASIVWDEYMTGEAIDELLGIVYHAMLSAAPSAPAERRKGEHRKEQRPIAYWPVYRQIGNASNMDSRKADRRQPSGAGETPTPLRICVDIGIDACRKIDYALAAIDKLKGGDKT